jgi:RNA polymerase sigma factor (TIGR02999 family)
MHGNGGDLATLLRRWSEGDSRAAEDVMPLVYHDLRKLARRYLRDERAGHTLQTTALVHEVFLRLQVQRTPGWQERGEFFGAVGALIRRILIDHARLRHADKRDCGQLRCPLESAFDAPYRSPSAVSALDDALLDLARLDSRKAKVVELRFFIGLSMEEVAEALGISVRTVNREWVVARAWLQKYIGN